MNIPKVSMFGVPISKLNARETRDILAEAVEQKQNVQVITANPIMIMAAMKQPDYLAMMKRAELVVPDGVGVVWAANYVGNPVAEKVAGIELMESLIRLGEDKGWKVFLLGASPEIIAEAAKKLQEKYPLMRLVGVRDGYFGSEGDEKVIREIREAEPDLLFVGRSADRQEPWIDQHKDRLNVPVIMGVGGSFDVLSGKLKRAPRWMIQLRAEWLYRLIKEPWRYKRMLDLPKFAWKVIRERDNVQKT